ncbi:hypothetical protein BpHYR1_048786 [Brachionus plicatilis]|uniref:Uncharacterized protein n=1 Tax=Brachionus plicatilis TaxID=10195 RepID=A0A3M7RU78_BRAPC|nr:hypothetical protein BpHYR1_048786 [Brachionus plicatilis]
MMLNIKHLEAGFGHSIRLVVRMVKENKAGIEKRFIEYPIILIFNAQKKNNWILAAKHRKKSHFDSLVLLINFCLLEMKLDCKSQFRVLGASTFEQILFSPITLWQKNFHMTCQIVRGSVRKAQTLTGNIGICFCPVKLCAAYIMPFGLVQNLSVPSATKVPYTINCRPLASRISLPGSIVKRAFWSTITSPLAR